MYHINTSKCSKGSERKRHRLIREEAWEGTDAEFREYGLPLTIVAEFKYLGRIVTAKDNDWPEVVANLRKARKKWARISRIIGWEEENERTPGNFFKAFIHYIYRSAESSLRMDCSKSIVSANMELVAAMPPHRPLEGTRGGREKVELGKGQQHSIGCTLFTSLPG